MNNESSSNSNLDSQALLNQLVIDYLKEKKRKRLWRWIIRAIILVALIYSSYKIVSVAKTTEASKDKEHIGLIDINGEIADSSSASADNFTKGIEKAYKSKGLKALIVRINSPGGSPVQAEYIYNVLQYYKSIKPNIKTYAVCVDMCASAAYYVAVGTDEIYASPASMVGSIGVLYNGFGFVDAMQKLGISRRLQTSGVNKAFLDPFSPTTEFQKEKLQTMLDIVHKQFITRVKEGRGNRLKINEETFSGLFWTGEQALANGLIDGYASSGQLAREVIKITDMVDYTYKQNVFDRLTKNLGTAMADELPVVLGIKPGLR
ncbi:TPA: S49 family peptidase [Legionella pneumophila]|nr:S49 family peptidase [Legionella pneumophila]HAU1296846.1 S49 family peptidase [Legionella pneumophila]